MGTGQRVLSVEEEQEDIKKLKKFTVSQIL
jgi:hypothetical protein